MSIRSEQALAAARHQSLHGPRFEAGMCLRETREVYGVGPVYPDAAAAWRNAPEKHVGDRNPPRGAVAYWLGGSGGHGHVAPVDGDGFIWSTDSRRPGFFDRVPLGAPEKDWGLTYAGWSPYLNGVRVYLDPWAMPPNFKRAESALTKAAKHARTADLRRLARVLRRALRKGVKP